MSLNQCVSLEAQPNEDSVSAKSVADVFADGGALARMMDGYKPREGQLVFASAVEHAFAAGSLLIAEVPAGVGKSFGYGVPIALRSADRQDKSGERALIVTSNIALQEQLVDRDLPFLSNALSDCVFTYAVLKGRGNYLCWSNLRKAIESERGFVDGDSQRLERMKEWASSQLSAGKLADRSELPAELHDDKLWSKVACGEGDCRGSACNQISRCFVDAAHIRAAGAQIVVCNYHLLFSAMKIAEQRGCSLSETMLPHFDLIVMDEAHRAADTARSFFGFSISEWSFKRAVALLRKLDKDTAIDVEIAGKALMDRLRIHANSSAYKARLRKPNEFSAAAALTALGAAADVYSMLARAESDAELKADLRAGANRCKALKEKLSEAEQLLDPESVYYIEADNIGVKLCSKLVDVSSRLRNGLWSKVKSAVVVSATMRVGGRFDHAINELGLPKEKLDTECVNSPFDFSSQAMLVVPNGMPEPTDQRFAAAVGAELSKIVAFARGRTMALFTSRRVLDEARKALNGCGYKVLVQGDAPRAKLIAEFRHDVSSVLLGLASFWEGIDVPGEALACLVIDRLPFPRPDDPVLDFVTEKIGRRSFAEFSIPRAVMTFCQGFGRLIRSVDDTGVVVVLDRRLIDKPYGITFLRSLPLGTRISEHIEDAETLLQARKPESAGIARALDALDALDDIMM